MTSFLTAATQTRFITHTQIITVIHMANVCFGDVSDILNDVLRLADVRCFVCKVMKECVSLQSVADREVFLPTDEIWLYDLQSGLCE